MTKICGACNLCCKVLVVGSLRKAGGVWCGHAKPGVGCSIYGEHPLDCQAFRCEWLKRADLDASWKPTTSKFILRTDMGGARLCVDVDPAYPDAWRKPAYYAAIKKWSEGMWSGAGHVVVNHGAAVTVIFPEEDIDIGLTDHGDMVRLGYLTTPFTRQPWVEVQRGEGGPDRRLGGIYRI